MEKRGHFASKIGIILASAGSAVGLGNIWRFPTEAGKSGGAVFILIYLACIFLMAMPVMIGEFVVGRASRANTIQSYRVLAPGKPWIVTGFIGVMASFLVLSFYSVVAGWTLNYSVESLCGTLMGNFDSSAYFQYFVAHPWHPVLYLLGFLALTHAVVAGGVEKGIERYSKFMMPLLFLIIILLVVCSLSMPGAMKGVEFLLSPDFSKVNTTVVLSAMGQAFFTLSVGIGVLATYASYFSDETNLVKSAVSVCIIDTLVAIMAGFIIFPAVFSVGMTPDAGPGLVFITLPNVFNAAFGGVPVLNYLFSGMFYLLLLLAALTSSISMHECGTAYISETFHLTRKKATCYVTGICAVLGVFCSLSFGPWQSIHILGMGFFDLFDFLTAKFFMPLGGILICTFVGWDMRHGIVARELGFEHIEKTWQRHAAGFLIFLLRWVAPLGIGVVFVYELMNK